MSNTQRTSINDTAAPTASSSPDDHLITELVRAAQQARVMHLPTQTVAPIEPEFITDILSYHRPPIITAEELQDFPLDLSTRAGDLRFPAKRVLFEVELGGTGFVTDALVWATRARSGGESSIILGVFAKVSNGMWISTLPISFGTASYPTMMIPPECSAPTQRGIDVALSQYKFALQSLLALDARERARTHQPPRM